MPFVGGKFYMNPAYGRGVENARKAAAGQHGPQFADQAPGTH